MLEKVEQWIIAFVLAIARSIISIVTITIKDFKILIRSKSSALIVIFGPLVMISLIGVAFNNSTIFDIRMGAYAESYSPLSEQIIQQLKDEQYSVAKAASRESCIDGVKRGDYNLCLLFSKDMSIERKNNLITFYVDYTRVNLVYAVMDNIAKKLTQTTNKLSLELTEALVHEIESTKQEIAGRISTVSALGSNNDAVQQKITGQVAKLTGVKIDGEYAELGIESIQQNLETLKEELGNATSSGTLTALQTKIDTLTKKAREHFDGIPTARTAITGAVTDLQNVNSILYGDKKSITSVKDSLDKITKGIEGLKVTDAENIVTPVQTSIQPVVTQTTHLTKLFPTFLTLVIMFVCIMLASTLVINEKNTNAYFRNFISPTHDGVFLLGSYITSFSIVGLQLGIILLASQYFLETSILGTLPMMVLPGLLVISLFILMGLFIGYVFNSQETATLASLFTVSGALLFSNTILPLEAIPAAMKKVVLLNPFVLSESVIKKVLIFGFSLEKVQMLLLTLGAFIALFFVLTMVALKLYKKKVRG